MTVSKDYPSYCTPSTATSYKRYDTARPFEGESYWQNSQGGVSRIRPGSNYELDVIDQFEWGFYARAWDRTLAGFVYYNPQYAKIARRRKVRPRPKEEAKSLKKSLEESAKRVQKWPDWKRTLESAATQSEYSRVPNPIESYGPGVRP